MGSVALPLKNKVYDRETLHFWDVHASQSDRAGNSTAWENLFPIEYHSDPIKYTVLILTATKDSTFTSCIKITMSVPFFIFTKLWRTRIEIYKFQRNELT